MILGLKGTYQGLTATIIKQGSNQAIRFYVMETLKNWYRGGDPNKNVPKLIVGEYNNYLLSTCHNVHISVY